ncbi:TetR/AcrR family transcriptional regulator [Priestia aryabhattai]|uniref:TetR/AcrR family transcriptional regulator n=1 Tax=Priestia aryabhattai TaxID=412384 RepID=UPI003D2AD8D9
MSELSTVEKIRAAAMELFGEKGYTETSLADISSKVGIKKPSLYAHFKNKDDLFLLTVHDLMNLFLTKLSVIYEQHKTKSAKEQLHCFVVDFCTMIEKDSFGQMYRRLILFPPEHLQSEVKAIFLRSERLSDQILHAIFTQGMAEGEIIERPIDLYINSFYCLTDALFIQRFYYEPEYYDQKIHDAWTIFWEGIRAK